MIYVTFDSNVWRIASNPSKFSCDPNIEALKKIHYACCEKKIEGRLSETIFTLEAIKRRERQSLIGNYEAKTSISEDVQDNGSIHITFRIGPDPTAHPRNNSFLNAHLADALAIGFRLMHCPRIGLLVNQDIKREWYVNSPINIYDIANKFGEAAGKIESVGAGMSWIKEIGFRYAKTGENWVKGLNNAPSSESKAIAQAVAEWADGDTVAAHIAYQNDYFCSRDIAKSGGKCSIFSINNRQWLEKDYKVKFILPEDLAKLI